MEAVPGTPAASADHNPVKYFYSKRSDSTVPKRSDLGRQPQCIADFGFAPPCNDQFELGAFYEIDHGKLPPKSPIQLKAIRVVKVSETTKLNVTVSFPSTLSLRNYFSTKPVGTHVPELDERFVMSSNHAGKILRRLIPASQLKTEKHRESFWLVAAKMEPEGVPERPAPFAGCLVSLKSAGVLGWGVRRRVKYIGRHRGLPSSVPEVEETKAVRQISGKKRGREENNKKDGKKKKKKEDKKKTTKVKCEDGRVRGPKDRWSTERYESAEMKLLEIMKKKGADLGNPILRQELREEARKHIGDTGLLDHLLKHMAGKTVTGGTERFRRRHNAEGAMEYWLEPSDLVELRRTAGVADPYWVPPPGWKLGDATSLCACGGEWKKEVCQLKEEVAVLKRDLEEVSAARQVEKKSEGAPSETESCCIDWQVSYEKLLKRSEELEKEVAVMSGGLKGLKEEMRVLKEGEKKREEISAVVTIKDIDEKGRGEGGDDKNGTSSSSEKWKDVEAAASTDDSNNGSNITTTNDYNGTGGSRKGIRRSGFRICKPQGTFLWPNMGTTTNAEKALMLFGGGHGFGGIPTPPSAASSTTSAPKLLLLPAPPTTPTSSAAAIAVAHHLPPRPSSSSSDQVPVVPTMVDSSSSSSLSTTSTMLMLCSSSGGGMNREEKKRNIEREGGGGGGGGRSAMITCTDLALATPSPYL